MPPLLGAARPPLALIVAVARNGVIGAHNTLPWRLRDDLRRFRAVTTGHAVIMGRRTWQSLPGALPGRQNIVVSRQPDFAAPGAIVVHSLDAALDAVSLPDPPFCIGGAELFAITLARATVLHVTEIDRDYDGDVFFPPFDRSQWREVSREARSTADAVPLHYAFVTYERNDP